MLHRLMVGQSALNRLIVVRIHVEQLNMNDEERKKDFEKCANEYERWKKQGNILRTAAVVLENCYNQNKNKKNFESEILTPLIYLKAKSLELYLKALYIKQGNPVTKDGILTFGGKSKTHDLLSLMELVGLGYNEEQKIKLLKLTNAIEFWGTYPVPLNSNNWKKGFEEKELVYEWNIRDNQCLDTFLVLLEEHLYEDGSDNNMTVIPKRYLLSK